VFERARAANREESKPHAVCKSIGASAYNFRIIFNTSAILCTADNFVFIICRREAGKESPSERASPGD